MSNYLFYFNIICSFTIIFRPGREADHSPLSTTKVKEWVALYFHSASTPSWRGAQLKHRDNFTLLLFLLVH